MILVQLPIRSTQLTLRKREGGRPQREHHLCLEDRCGLWLVFEIHLLRGIELHSTPQIYEFIYWMTNLKRKTLLTTPDFTLDVPEDAMWDYYLHKKANSLMEIIFHLRWFNTQTLKHFILCYITVFKLTNIWIWVLVKCVLEIIWNKSPSCTEPFTIPNVTFYTSP